MDVAYTCTCTVRVQIQERLRKCCGVCNLLGYFHSLLLVCATSQKLLCPFAPSHTTGVTSYMQIKILHANIAEFKYPTVHKAVKMSSSSTATALRYIKILCTH